MKLVILIMMFVCTSSAQNEEVSILVWVNRRSTNDLYKNFGDDLRTVCVYSGVNTTILVSEKRCVRNQDLFSGKFQYSNL